jgi:N-acetylmuramoyl-L-alanine amidase
LERGAAVHTRLLDGLGATDRGLKRARFAVLLPVDCPAVLIEAGFLSNQAEAAKIATPAYRQKIAEAIGAGIGHYHDRLRAAARD